MRSLLWITLEIEAVNEGEGAGNIEWIGLQNEELLKKYLKHFERFDENWEPYLKPLSYEPDFMPKYGLLLNKDEVESLRSTYEEILKNNSVQFMENAREALDIAPEKRIKDYVNMHDDFQFCRERDYEQILISRPINNCDFSNGLNAALTGILLKDKELLRLSARFALSIAFCTNWTDGFVNKMPGSNFEVKAFVPSLCTYEVVHILDLAWDYFTIVGRQYIMRRLAEEGISNINWMIWKHAEKPEEIFKMNQLAWFSPARICGYALLEKEWKHIYPYTDLAYEELLESIECLFGSEGGYTEGPAYFGYVCREVMRTIYFYSSARSMKTVSLPDNFKRTADYIEAFVSTNDDADIISSGDAGHAGKGVLETMAIMAALMPQSAWVFMFWKAYNRIGSNKFGFFIQKFYPQITKTATEFKSFIFISDIGVMTSTRKLQGEYVKIFINGNKANAGHAHSDKGSFVLEFAGDTFAMDPGVTVYGDEMSVFMRSCSRHNMLVPYGLNIAPSPLYPIPFNVKPKGFGDEKSFQAEMDATPGWEEFYDKWIRKWDSPEPNIIIIKDEYRISKGKGVEFYWNTKLDVQIQNQTAIIRGKRGRIVIEVPKDCIIRLDILPYLENQPQKRIAICKEGIEGILEVKVNLIKE